MNAPSSVPHPLVGVSSVTHALSNRFLLSVVAMRRSKQLNAGAAARVARDGHKPTYLAVLEVMGNTISWSRD